MAFKNPCLSSKKLMDNRQITWKFEPLERQVFVNDLPTNRSEKTI